MNPTETTTTWEHLAGALFDEVVVPLAEARRRRGAADYFPRHRDATAATYFVEPGVRTVDQSLLEISDPDPTSLVDALTSMWRAQGDVDLEPLVPHLRDLAAALADESMPDDGTVDPLCYTLF